mgnify:CR=1 FL=1
MMQTEPSNISVILTIIAFLGIYFLPTIVARKRCPSKSTAVFILNLFLGWTLLGWVIALAMAFGITKEKAQS